MRPFIIGLVLGAGILTSSPSNAQQLPFTYKVETYREEEGPVRVFALRLEQPFLAEEFEKSNFIRLKATDENAYLIYPRETKFANKHAEFYGRLRGEGKATLELSYEVVSENLDGSLQVDTRKTKIAVNIPAIASGSEDIYRQWAIKQNDHFVNLLQYYPDESFLEYVLLQSKDRYGIKPPNVAWRRTASTEETEADLYYLFSGGLGVQQALQYQTLGSGPNVGDLSLHISSLRSPSLKSIKYDEVLAEKIEAGKTAQPHDLARLVPVDQYFLQLNSMDAADQLTDLSVEWGESLLRMYTLNARNQQLSSKYEQQLGVDRNDLRVLFESGALSQLAITGSDFFLSEGTDITLLLRVEKSAEFEQAVEKWSVGLRARFPELIEREFNYRGHRVAVRYTGDRMASSFLVIIDNHAVISNSHVAVRKVIDTAIGRAPSLFEADDYKLMTTVLAPSDEADSAYLYASDAFQRRLVSPEFKIAEKRRLQSFNNLVMLNNASLFYRLENGTSPETLTDLVEGKFVNSSKIICPHGGAYAFDAERDTCTSSLYNRIKYLTPIVELDVLKVSSQEKQQYDRYRNRYDSFWKQFFNPIGVRLSLSNPVTIETQMLPFANGSLHRMLGEMLDEQPQKITTAGIAKSAVASLTLVPGRETTSTLLAEIPGVREALQADPTLTDLSWLGDQVSVHACDSDVVLEIDPTRIRQLKTMFQPTLVQQSLGAFALTAINQPVYFTIDVEDEQKAERFIKKLSSRLFLESGELAGLSTELDAYRLPDYKGHVQHVLSFRLYAVKLRLHLAVVNGKLVAATKPHVLREVIDAAADEQAGDEIEAHAQLRINRRALDELQNNLGLYWAEKARHAAHRNIMPIYMLIKLYGVPIEQVNALADAKYGVTYYSPDGEYKYDSQRDVVYSTVYGNRQEPRQQLSINDDSSFGRFLSSLQELRTSLELNDDGIRATVVIERQ